MPSTVRIYISTCIKEQLQKTWVALRGGAREGGAVNNHFRWINSYTKGY
jgi:hypothetical protein